MKSLSFVIAIGLVAFAATLANAQQKTNVCIIDLAQVFRSHPTFNQQLTQLQKEAEAFKSKMNEQRTALIARNDRLMAMALAMIYIAFVFALLEYLRQRRSRRLAQA